MLFKNAAHLPVAADNLIKFDNTLFAVRPCAALPKVLG